MTAKSASQWGNYHVLQPPPPPLPEYVRVDPKAFFSNERTFIQWMHISVTMGAISLTLATLADSADVRTAGVLLIAPSISFLLYGLFSYYRRLALTLASTLALTLALTQALTLALTLAPTLTPTLTLTLTLAPTLIRRGALQRGSSEAMEDRLGPAVLTLFMVAVVGTNLALKLRRAWVANQECNPEVDDECDLDDDQ